MRDRDAGARSGRFASAVSLARHELTTLRVLGTSGVVRPYSPRTLARLVSTLRRWGLGPAGGFTSLALRHPDRVGVIDERGETTWGEIHARSNAIARGLRGLGVREGDAVAVLCRNHRGFVEGTIAVAKLGADVLYLNTAFAAPQLGEVCGREGVVAVVHDEEFDGLVDQAGVRCTRVLAWTEADGDESAGAGPGTRPTLNWLAASSPTADLEPPGRVSRSVILTSGTTGAPKGAPRSEGSFAAGVSLLSRLPLRAGWRSHVAAPLFHTWGWAHLALAMLLGTTLVLRRKFDPEECLRAVADTRSDSLVVIPVMLQRILQLPPETLDRYDLSSVRVVASSGSALPGDLGIEWMDRFGDTLYNIYGSTEVAWVTIATPEDLRARPGTAGRPPHATDVRLYDDAGSAVPAGESGRIFVGNSMLFEGYTGGGSKDVVDGLMATGDVGRFDEGGRLVVEGRDDEMIVSGGENVFPQEVEDCLARHDAVKEAAAIGVDDPDYGSRLRAFVVPTSQDAVTEDELRDHVKQNLARYKVPREIVFLTELPRNATGKILKRELADRAD
ncbi:MAG TPA: AMP-binding protein [Nocardioidaceae bacterium]|jgi:fatty-acyl-CoA synthase|nr:AMP-binding protein [Nocardioidaceae bacterium]